VYPRQLPTCCDAQVGIVGPQQRTKPRCRKLRLPFPCGLFNHTLPRRSNRSRKCDGASPSRGRECGGVGGCRAHGSRRSRWSIQRV